MTKPLLLPAVLLITIMLSALEGAAQFGFAQPSNTVGGIIDSDTTWTNADSPLTFTENVLVNQGVTLTISPGATVNLNNYYIKVDGFLDARGNNTHVINFSGGQIIFTRIGAGWNEQTGSGSIIEEAILNETRIWISNSAKINNNTIDYSHLPIGIDTGIDITVGSPIISNNTITGNYRAIKCGGSAMISNNSITGFGVVINLSGAYGSGLNSGAVTISGNNISLDGWGIAVANGVSGTIIIERNQITDCRAAIRIGEMAKGAVAIIENNTIANNAFGIGLHSKATIVYNNLVNNGQTSLGLTNIFAENVDATNNWWGTTDVQAINQSIRKNVNYLSNVTFVPFLTSPNPQAPAIPTPAPTPTIIETSTPSPTQQTKPEQTETSLLPYVIVAVAVVIAFFVCVLATKLRAKKSNCIVAIT